MITGKTQTGFEFSVSEEIQNDMEVIDALAELDSGDTLAISRLCLLVFGKEQRKRFYDFLRTESGHVPGALVEQGIMDVFNAFNGTGKNS